jgi:hypothetical protein
MATVSARRSTAKPSCWAERGVQMADRAPTETSEYRDRIEILEDRVKRRGSLTRKQAERNPAFPEAPPGRN